MKKKLAIIFMFLLVFTLGYNAGYYNAYREIDNELDHIRASVVELNKAVEEKKARDR